MRILFFDAGSYVYHDVYDCMKKMGHDVHTIYYHFANRFSDTYFEYSFKEKIMSRSFDVIFSINFYPLVATIARDTSIPYISWSYDSPLAERLSDYFKFGTNMIFLFDRYETEKYQKMGFYNVYHMPLASNAERIEKMSFSEKQIDRFSSDISFVGQLYAEPILYHLMGAMDEYLKGYIEALLSAQLEIYGDDILTPSLTQEMMERIWSYYKEKGVDTKLTETGLKFAIQKQITFAERVTLLSTLSEHFELKYFGSDNYEFDSPVHKMGPVRYTDEMPAVFRYSKLNLCPTIRSIVTGIPLRALDIMASGGVLFSNYQVELAESFRDGDECILYYSLEEVFDKANYYLNNEKELKRIAQNGLKIVKEQFTFKERISSMLQMI